MQEPTEVAAVNDTGEPPPLLQMKGISRSFAGVQALRDVSFDVRGGEVHALLGENGAGKSTLMRVLFGLLRAESGDIFLRAHGRVIVTDPRHALSLGIGLVSQEPSVVPQLDVAQNVFLGSLPTLSLTDRHQARAESRRILEPFAPGLSVTAEVATLGMAERQVVEIARALARGGEIIAFDEPTSSLTPSERDGLFDLIRSLKAAGKGIIYISHRMSEIQEIADRVTVLRDGEVVAEGATTEFTPDELNDLIAGRELAAEMQQGGQTSSSAERLETLRTVGLSSAVLDNVDLSLFSGQIFGLAGLVGSGRTELVRTIFGADRKTAGQILINGAEVRIDAPSDAMHHGIALIPEDRRGQSLVPMMTVTQNFGLGSHGRLTRWGILQGQKRRKALAGYIRDLDIRPPRGDIKISALSGGNQQKVVIARWLYTGANIFLFDEPTRGIDVGAKSEIHNLLRRLAEAGSTVLVITSELPELLSIADRIGIMRDGRLVETITNEAGLSEGHLMRLAAGELH